MSTQETVTWDIRGIAVAIMRESDWPLWVAMDGNFQPDYSRWHRRIETAIKKLHASGVRVERVVVDPVAFDRWRRERGLPMCASARAAFAAQLMAERDEGNAAA